MSDDTPRAEGEVRYCTNCGTRQQSGVRFCGSCGSELRGPGEHVAAQSMDVPQFRSPREPNEQGGAQSGIASQATPDPLAARALAVGQPAAKTPVAAGAVLCPVCNRQSALDRRFCQWCGQFLLKTDGSLKYAGFGRRLGAYVIDFVAPYFVIVTAFSIALGADDSANAAVAVLFLVPLGWIILQLAFWARGTSFGKMLVGARVMRTDGSRVTFWTMFVREFIAKAIVGTIVSVFTLGIGWLAWYLWALWDKDSQALHDKFVSSLVVYNR